MNPKFIILLVFALGLVVIVLGGANSAHHTTRKEKVSNVSTANFETISVISDKGTQISEDPWTELEKLMGAYYDKEMAVRYSGHMRLVDNNGEKEKVIEEMEFMFQYYNGEYYYRMGALECVNKKKMTLVVNHTDKTIAITNSNDSKESTTPLINFASFKELLKEKAGEVKVSSDGTQRILTVNNIQDPSIQGYQIYYDPVDYSIKKMIIGMIRLSPIEPAEGNGTEVDSTGGDSDVEGYSYNLEVYYDVRQKKEPKGLDKNPEDQFVQRSGSSYILNKNFSDYRFLN